jgi:hypothetical protein
MNPKTLYDNDANTQADGKCAVLSRAVKLTYNITFIPRKRRFPSLGRPPIS